MNQDKVKVLTLKPLNDGKASLFRLLISLLGGSNFTGDVKLFSIDFEFFYDFGNLELIFVDAGSVDMPVSHFKSMFQALKTFITFELISAIT